jgi:hypothetical protein
MKTLLAIPNDGFICAETVQSLFTAGYKFDFLQNHVSKLTLNFNVLLCHAMNNNYEYFIMLHNDIVPVEFNWMKELISILEDYDLDILGVNNAIKNNEGLTSTAIEGRNISIVEAAKKDILFNENLDINTGLMIIKLSNKFKKLVQLSQLRFRVEDTIEFNNEKFQANGVLTEDWLFSRDCIKLGLNVASTSLIKTAHLGNAFYTT